MGRAAGDSNYYELAIIDGTGQPRGRPVYLPSVTTILEALPKFLQWWGYKLGIEAMSHYVTQPEKAGSETIDELYDHFKKNEQYTTPSRVLQKAAGRGSDVHHLAEKLVRTGKLPPPEKVPEEQHGYAMGLNRWWKREVVDGDWQVEASEIPVFSLDHRYAGTLDLLLSKHNPAMTTKDPGGTIQYKVVDFKTNAKGAIYESHLLQSTAYAHAVHEMGMTDSLPEGWVMAVSEKGDTKNAKSPCTIDEFLDVKKVWMWLQKMKEEVKV